MSHPALIVIGQSNGAYDARWYEQRHPDRANVLFPRHDCAYTLILADLLIERLDLPMLVVANTASEGTYSCEWQPENRCWPNVLRANTGTLGCDPRWVLWQHGEGDADVGVAAQTYIYNVSTVAAAFPDAEFFVPRTTFCVKSPPGAETIRRAQKELGKMFKPGPDFDTLGLEWRCDGCHFSPEGMQRVAEMWADCIIAESWAARKQSPAA